MERFAFNFYIDSLISVRQSSILSKLNDANHEEARFLFISSTFSFESLNTVYSEKDLLNCCDY